MTRATDLQISDGAQSHSLIGQQIFDGTALHTMKGGTAVYDGQQWYIWRESLNAQVRVSVAAAGTLSVSFRSLPGKPFRPSGVYPIAGEAIDVRVRLTGALHLTDGTDEAYDFTAGPFPCDGAEHSVTDSASVPSGKELYRADIYAAEILFSDEGMDEWAYAQGEVGIESVPRRFTASAGVSPFGAGTATATPGDPLYGQRVKFEAGESDRNAWRFTRWASGEKSRSYSVQAFGDVADTALFEDASYVVDFAFTLSVDPQGRLKVMGKTLQNRVEAFVRVSFDIRYLDTVGEGQTAVYEREIHLDGQQDIYAFEGTEAAQILEASAPQFGDMPEPFSEGDVAVEVAN